MRAVVYAEKGPSTVMRLAERPVPEPGPGQVRVRLVRAGVNPTDWKARAGVSSPMGFAEVTPGQDGAGVIDALGAGVHGLAAGDRVWVFLGQHGLPFGTAAEYCVVDWHRVVRLPDSVAGEEAFDLGASLGVPVVTAHRALTFGPRAARRAGMPRLRAGRDAIVQDFAFCVRSAANKLQNPHDHGPGRGVARTIWTERVRVSPARRPGTPRVNCRAAGTVNAGLSGCGAAALAAARG